MDPESKINLSKYHRLVKLSQIQIESSTVKPLSHQLDHLNGEMIQNFKINQLKGFMQSQKLKGDTDVLYFIDFNWVNKWIKFLLSSSSIMPGPIYNGHIVQKLADEEDLILGKNVLVITASLWTQLERNFGGGPILKQHCNISHNLENDSTQNESQIRLDESSRVF